MANSEAELYTYRIMWSDEEQTYLGLCAEFPEIGGRGASPDEALENARAQVAQKLQGLRVSGGTPPTPLVHKQDPNLPHQ
jgi:predicted RNase H-like HicB family nuclease